MKHIGKLLSDSFPIHSGIKQGDALEPLLFNFTLEQCGPTRSPRAALLFILLELSLLTG
jgi:hypothetical protein